MAISFAGYMIFAHDATEAYNDTVYEDFDAAIEDLLDSEEWLSVNHDSENFWEYHYSIDQIYDIEEDYE